MEADVLYRMMCATKLIPKHDNGCQYEVGDITAHEEFYFVQIFNMEKINRILKANKVFHCHIMSDGMSASILYKVPLRVLKELDSDEIVKRRYEDGEFIYELGIDPGIKTWNATVRRHIETGKEMNFKISSKRYHYLAKEGIRKRKREKWTRQFNAFEENDRNDRARYPQMPSPKGTHWRDYITHRLTIMKQGIATYTTAKYSRLRFNKYIESNRVCDKIAAMLVICYRKNWRQNRANDMDVIAVERPADFDFSADYVPDNFFDQPEESILATVWHRDITAAKLIMYRGHCQLFGFELHNNFTCQRLVYPRWIGVVEIPVVNE